MKPRCMNCNDKPARPLPRIDRDRHFCTIRCAARYAISEKADWHDWCEKHNSWNHCDYGCLECKQVCD